MKTVFIATRNKGKLEEIRAILGSDLNLKSLFDFGEIPDTVEDGETFEANARKKAGAVSRSTGCVAIADDSGLLVDALSGAPGVHSARFAGPHATDAQNNAKLLALMEGLPKKKRTARFRCVIAVSTPEGPIRTACGECEGRILEAPAGRGGFGYDPLFFLPELDQTFAELTFVKKNQISHRSRALQAARPLVEEALRASCKPDLCRATGDSPSHARR